MTELPWSILLQFLLGKIKPDVLELLLLGTLSKGADISKWEIKLSKKQGKASTGSSTSTQRCFILCSLHTTPLINADIA